MITWRLRLRLLDGASETTAFALRSALARVGGMAIVRDEEAAPYDPMIAMCDGDPEAVLHFLATEEAGLSRVIAAAPGASRWDDQTVWRVLGSGVEEMLDTADTEVEAGLASIHQRLQRWWTVDEALASSRVQSRLAGRSLVWQRALRGLIQAAVFGTHSVLLTGETGTGKEAAARLIHDLDRTRLGNFVIVDCGSIVETLSGSELFGHKRGAFTGAERDREGAIAKADGGTLFLDEVGELKPALQAELLRVLQEGTFKPVGDDRSRQSRFRLVAATNRDLWAMVGEGKFRSDLYYRIAAVTCHLPPLRERGGDKRELVGHFLREFFAQGPGNGPVPPIDPRLDRFIARLPFPGNVRQLKNFVQALAANHDGGPLRPAHLPSNFLVDLADGPSDWEDHLGGAIEAAIRSRVSLDQLVEKTKLLACESALKMEGSARKAAHRIGVSTRMVEKRRTANGVQAKEN
jgi:transcriptional regulator with GAF, ATPase, and Fis domain